MDGELKMGKGSRQRPVDRAAFSKAWDRIFAPALEGECPTCGNPRRMQTTRLNGRETCDQCAPPLKIKGKT